MLDARWAANDAHPQEQFQQEYSSASFTRKSFTCNGTIFINDLAGSPNDYFNVFFAQVSGSDKTVTSVGLLAYKHA